jgi:hypothetical protein
MRNFLIEKNLVLVRKGRGFEDKESERFEWTAEMARRLMRSLFFTRRLVHDLENGEKVCQANAEYWLEKNTGGRLDNLVTCPDCGKTWVPRELKESK